MRPSDILNRLHGEPFRPFRVHLSDGTFLDVPEAGMVIVGESSAVLPSSFEKDGDGHRLAKQWRTIAINHIVQFSNLDESENGKRRRR